MEKRSEKEIEILAPVGSFDALKAAVQNGANAVYLGGKEFSARASANNFDREELKEAVRYCHIRDCKVFVTVNTIIKESETDDFIEYVKYLYKTDVDAIILQDIGMADTVKRVIPDFELHASTQMAAHSLNDVLFLQQAGFKRVVLARELSVEEIEYISGNSTADIEVFVHGALCVSYSGQCLMSSVLGNRSGNRGRCAQPCRQRYSIKNIKTGEVLDVNGQYLLSPRDLNTVEHIDRIIDTGILSLKIEGRMKRPEYVATVVKAYRDAADSYMKSHRNGISSEEIDELYTIFNRKFTGGYILGEVGSDVMNRNKPNNRGLYIGDAVSYNRKAKRLKIKLKKTLKKGDGLNIGGGTVGRIIKGREISAVGRAGETVEIDYVGDVKSGQEIFKTSDTDLIQRVRKTYDENRELVKIPVYAKLRIEFGKAAELVMGDYSGREVTVHGEKPAEKALKVAITEEKAEKQISKTGDTPYRIEELKLDIDEGISIPVSELNNIRRTAAELLSSERVKVKGRSYKVLDGEKVSKISKESVSSEINVSCERIDSLKEILNHEIDSVYYRDINTLKEAAQICSGRPVKLYYYMPRIIRAGEKKVYKRLLSLDDETLGMIDGFRLSNYGEIYFIKNNFPEKEIRIASWLNVINSRSIDFYENMDADRICLSQEMSLSEIKNLDGKYNNLEYLVYGNAEMMLSEYCPMGVLVKDCKKNKRDALCNKSDYALVSADGDEYRLSQSENCRTTIYSQEVVNLAEDIDRLSENGIKSYEIVIKFEDKNETGKIMDSFVNAVKEGRKVKSSGNCSSGHLYREID